MKSLQVAMFCCLSVACVKASEMLETRGHVGGEVSFQCSVSWTQENSSENIMYFCKGACSRENVLIEMERIDTAVTWGRYSMEVQIGFGVFNVTIKQLQRADAGRYCCGVKNTLYVLHQEVNLVVIDASIVPTGSSGSLPHGSFQSTTESSAAAALTLSSTEKTNKKATVNLTDTTVVIIISVSMALLVCALIPLVFYGRWRSDVGQSGAEANKWEGGYCEENADQASTVGMVKLQSLQPDPEPSAQ